LLESPVFDPITGFGGTGEPGTYILPEDPDGTSKFFDRASFVGCVPDGPFASQIVRLGPGKFITDHCLVRGVDDRYKSFLSSRSVASTMKFSSYFDFHVDLEGAPITSSHRIHDGGHVAVGGEMSNFYSSPGGQRFYFLHLLEKLTCQIRSHVLSPSRQSGSYMVELATNASLSPSRNLRSFYTKSAIPKCHSGLYARDG
jgi:hypothetical protein